MPATLDDILREMQGLRRDMADGRSTGPVGRVSSKWMPLPRAAEALGMKPGTLQKQARAEWERSGCKRIFDLGDLRMWKTPGSNGKARFQVSRESVYRERTPT